MTAFQVEFNVIPDDMSWDVCFTINSDNDSDTGFDDAPAMGIDWVYCWASELKEIFITQFGAGGEYINDFTVEDPLSYVATNAEGNVLTSPFAMMFPPPGIPELKLEEVYEIYAEGHFWNLNGDWVWDRAGPLEILEVLDCPF